MRLIITDTGNIWNIDNPFLKRFKEIVLVVCLRGEKVTDEYECFVSPYKKESASETDIDGNEKEMLNALASVADRFSGELMYNDDLVFLTDNEPSTIYPYYVVKDLEKHNSLHLVAMAPMSFESIRRIKEYRKLLRDLSELDSLLYFDTNQKLERIDEDLKISEFFDYVRDELGNMMPRFLNGINRMEGSVPCYFDFSSMEYVSLKDGFNSIIKTSAKREETEIDFPIERIMCTLGRVIEPSYPTDEEYVKDTVEKPDARLDGKRICNILREQRIKLAEANNITFESEECPSIGACAGTCEKCDTEAEYLREKMRKIPVNQRVYPAFDPGEEVSL